MLKHGRIASKPEAARWAIKAIGEPWARLIGKAFNWQNGMVFDKLDEMLEFILFTLQEAGVSPAKEAGSPR